MLGSCSYSSKDKLEREYRVELEEMESSEESKKRRKASRKTKKRSRGALRWEKDDEITLLEQLYEFSGCKASYSKAFYEYVKPRLKNKEVTKSEMSRKIGGLKKECFQNIEWRRKGNELKFPELHQRQVFVLSNRIWGDGRMKGSKGFREFLKNMEIDVNCLMPSCLEYLKKEWEVQTLMKIHLLKNKSKLDAKLRELMLFDKSLI